MKHLRPLLRLLVLPLALTLAAPLAAQRVTIDPWTQFEGLLEVLEQDDPLLEHLYDAWTFGELEGQTVSAEAFAEWKQRWATRKAEAERTLALWETEPWRRFGFELDFRLRRSDYFKKRFDSDAFALVDDHAPYLLYIQRSEDEDAGKARAYVDGVAAFYGPPLVRLDADLEEEYVRPLGLKRRRGHEGYALFILRDRDQYNEYGKEFEMGDQSHVRAHYDPRLRVGITYNEAGAGRSDAVREREDLHPALHEMVHAFEHAYYEAEIDPNRGRMPMPSWFLEGFAEYFAYHSHMASKGKPKDVPPDSLRSLNGFLDAKPELAFCLLPIQQLAGAMNYNDAVRTLNVVSQKNGIGYVERDEAMQFLYRQSDLLMHYLHNGDDGRYEPAIRRYVHELLKGADPAQAIERGFDGVDLDAMNSGFLGFLQSYGLSGRLADEVRASWKHYD